MKTLYIILIISLTTILNASAQSTIEGTIKERAGGEVLEFATVTLYRSHDKSFVGGEVTDHKGHFLIKNLKEGKHYLTIQFLGFTTDTISDIAVLGGKNLDLGVISLEGTEKLLAEVVVNGEKAKSIHKIDKQIYDASQFQSSQGGTAIDVLKNTPSINVNSEGNITLRGSNGFLVLINGKPVQADPNVILNQLPANAIDNVEIITAPSAKFDADGKAGIINITTKRGTLDGFSLIVNGQGGLPAIYTYNNLKDPQRFGADATLNFRKGKWDVTIGGNYQRNDIAGKRVGEVSTAINNISTLFPSSGERSFIKKNYTARALLTFTPDKNNSFSAGIYNGNRTQVRRADIVYHNTKVDLNSGNTTADFTYFNSNVVKKTGDITLGNLDYSHTFVNKSSLSLSGLYEHAELSGEVKNINQSFPETENLLQYTYNPSSNPLNAYRVKADYGIDIDSGKLELGYQYRYQEQKGNFQYLEQNLQTGEFFLYPDFSSTTNVTNQIHSFYGQYSGRRNRWEYIGGLRYEYATREFLAKNVPAKNLNLSNFFPSLNLQYKLKNDLRLRGGYSKRVQRSTSNELNPYPEREHSETLEQGDPNILPEFVDLAEIGAVEDFTIGNVFATLYHQHIKNVVNRVNSVYNDTILNRIYTNAGKANQWGIEVGTTLRPLKWWSIYLGGNVYDYKIKGTLFNNDVKVNAHSWAYSINTNSSFQLSPSLSFQFNLNYLSERVTAQGKDSRFIIPNSSLKKTFLKGRLSTSLQWQNMDLGLLGTNKQRITTWGKDFYTSTNYIQETDIFLINLSFNLNQVTKKAKLPTSEFGEKEF
jgi:ferric enterobactin receptor